MPDALRILIVDENAARAALIEAGLREAGHDSITVIGEIAGLLHRVVQLDPQVIVVDFENPNRDAVEHVLQLSRTVRRPVAMFVDRSDKAMMEAAIDAGVSAYVVDGLRQERVKPILDMAISRFNADKRIQDELSRTRQALEERKVIDRAKGILMKRRGLSEEAAYALLRRSAMNENRRMAEVAQSLVTALSLLTGDGP